MLNTCCRLKNQRLNAFVQEFILDWSAYTASFAVEICLGTTNCPRDTYQKRRSLQIPIHQTKGERAERMKEELKFAHNPRLFVMLAAVSKVS